VGEYQKNLDLNIRRIRVPLEDENVDFSNFMPVSPFDFEEMESELIKILKTVVNPFLAKLIDAFINDEEFMEMFRAGVASKVIHHPYLGGLMEHTLSIVQIVDFLSSHYPEIDRDILLTGAFLHDIGKLTELSSGPELGYTDKGTLIGHMVLGAEMVRDKIRDLPAFPEELETEVVHTVLSHQGELEWGAPVLPMTREALIIHFVDNLDAKQFVAKQAVKDCREDGNFTQKIYPLNRVIYKRNNLSE
ncbi:3'-5' exoribonuclease YhaM family protein, partial [Planctomycetota bacterium]